MIANFDDFCTWMYTSVDDIWHQFAPSFRRPGPVPACSDSELITLVLVGECRGWDVETELLHEWQCHRHPFPVLPSQSRLNRRRRQLQAAFNLIRQAVVALLDVAQERQCAIDSLPIPVVAFHNVPASTGDWRAYGASFGRVPSKQQTIFGYKLQVFVTLGGVILDVTLAGAHAPDSHVGADLLVGHTDRDVVGDKAYLDARVQAELAQQHRLRLITLPRRNQRQQVDRAMQRVLNGSRQIIETVHGQLAEQFNIEVNHAHTFWGLCTRLYSKLTAHTLCIYINRLLGNANFLQIKQLAFPN